MPPKKKTATDPATADAADDKKQQRAVIKPKSKFEWGALLKQARIDHWRTLRVTIQFRDKMLAGKPVSLDVAEKMIKARGLEDVLEALPENPEERAQLAEQAVNEGTCEFVRRPGKPGIWFPSNNIKAGIKENWSVLGLRMTNRGSRGAIAEGLFVYGPAAPDAPAEERDWIYLGEKPAGVHKAISHTMSPAGPVHALKMHEYVERVTVVFEVAVAKVLLEKLPDEDFAKMMVHFAEHGLGACRSQGFGKFDIVAIEDVELAGGEHLQVDPTKAA